MMFTWSITILIGDLIWDIWGTNQDLQGVFLWACCPIGPHGPLQAHASEVPDFVRRWPKNTCKHRLPFPYLLLKSRHVSQPIKMIWPNEQMSDDIWPSQFSHLYNCITSFSAETSLLWVASYSNPRRYVIIWYYSLTPARAWGRHGGSKSCDRTAIHPRPPQQQQQQQQQQQYFCCPIYASMRCNIMYDYVMLCMHTMT